MQYFDSQRPRLSGVPCYMDLAHRRVIPLLPIEVEPCGAAETGEILFQAKIMIKQQRAGVRQFGAYWFHTRPLLTAELPCLFEDFSNDPEEALARHFGYTGPGEPRVTLAPLELSPEVLGL